MTVSSSDQSLDKKQETLPHSEAGSPKDPVRKLLFFFGVLLLEAFHSPFSIHDFLRPGEKGMAIGANIDIDVPDGRSGFKTIPTGTVDDGLPIDRMNPLFHAYSLTLAPTNDLFVTEELEIYTG